ncbi:gamma-glutamyl-gamma-aminobutyrate hydrolase family protein [Holzapfeliella sp. He02]|uniref:Gamma-glutamyl-gamma-aminobutyrate hydrolase family protein n=1 Tax=Holzapfeliella saturejae TaxID=3082953 RepID=A0ABU8SED8_9LACO
MTQPIIGISGSFITDEGAPFPGYRRSYVNEDYVTSVSDNGGIPFIIPLTNDASVIKQQIDAVDALILSGGHDVSPRFYHEEPKANLGDISPERDEFDFALLKYAEEKQIPVLGICRGAQIMNVFHGGSLHQDLSYRSEDSLKHNQQKHPDMTTHSVNIAPDSKLFDSLKTTQTLVNSFHHQVINQLADTFVVSATASDGVIEGFESPTHPFLLAVQWHPEMLHRRSELMNQLFKSLINHTK